MIFHHLQADVNTKTGYQTDQSTELIQIKQVMFKSDALNSKLMKGNDTVLHTQAHPHTN